MRTYDFTPLYRSAVGFDRLAGLLETAARTSQENDWPPYNIETTVASLIIAILVHLLHRGVARRLDADRAEIEVARQIGRAVTMSSAQIEGTVQHELSRLGLGW